MQRILFALLVLFAPLSGWAQINSTESFGLTFSTSGAERMRLSSGGWLGIGVTSPSTKLEVRDSLNSTLAGQIYNTSTGASAQTRLNISSGSPNAYLSLFSAENTGNPYGMLTFATGHTAGYISTEANAPLIFRTSATEAMRIASDGKVGIGTASPLASLDVRGLVYSSSSIGGFGTYDRTTGIGSAGFYRSGGINRLWDNTAGDVITYSASGWVGINTANPSYTLDVTNGDIRARSAGIGGTYVAATNTGAGGRTWGILSTGTGSSGGSGNLIFWDATGPQGPMIITSGGNVGIGNVAPQMALDVSSTTGYAIRGITSANAHAIWGQSLNAAQGGVAGVAANGTIYGILGHANAYSFYGSGSFYNSGNAQVTGQIFSSSMVASSYIQTNGSLVLASTIGNRDGYYLCWQSSDGYTGYGSSCSNSDARLKKNIQPLESSLEKIVQLHGVSFEWKDAKRGTGRHTGLIAQDVEKVFPDLVETTERSGYKTLQYEKLVAPLIEAVKELKTENDALKNDNKRLWQAIDALNAKLDARP